MALFTASEFRALDSNQYGVTGQLQIRDITQTLSFPFSLDFTRKGEMEEAHMRSSFSLNRLNFGVGQGEWADGEAIGQDVQIDISLKATRLLP